VTDQSVGERVAAGPDALAHDRGDHWIVAAPWASADERERVLDRYLAPAETDELARLSPAAREGRALGRIAGKEAVRAWLAAQGGGAVPLAAIRITNEPSGRPRVTVGGHEPVGLSLAHCGTTAVAALWPRPPGPPDSAGSPPGAGPGVDVEVIEARGPVFARLACRSAELRLGTGLDPDEWVTRLWTVKEAVAKAAATGLRGRPKDVVVDAVAGDLSRVGPYLVRSVREGRLVVSVVVTGRATGGGKLGPGYLAPTAGAVTIDPDRRSQGPY
jgi:phosphopantetheinyl transferase